MNRKITFIVLLCTLIAGRALPQTGTNTQTGTSGQTGANAQADVTARADTNGVYELGSVVVEAPAMKQDASALLPAAAIEKMNRLTVSDALNLLPGITQSNIGPRNESVVYLRGFDLRRVPLFIDGIPVYVPYDGYVDLGRFTTFDLSEIQVSKGNSSVLYGANTMGGAINLVTRKPSRPLELNGALGWVRGGQRAHLNAGAVSGKFYTQLGISHYQRDHYLLSENSALLPLKTEEKGIIPGTPITN